MLSAVALRVKTLWVGILDSSFILSSTTEVNYWLLNSRARNVDDRKPVPEMTQDIFGKLFGDWLRQREAHRGYISQDLFEKLYEQQLKLITRYKKNMKQKLVKLIDKILLRKRALIETVNDQLKNIFQIEHSRHRSIWNFLVNLMAGLIAYTYLPNKPSIDLEPKELLALPPAVF
jgi:hypothetical protein